VKLLEWGELILFLKSHCDLASEVHSLLDSRKYHFKRRPICSWIGLNYNLCSTMKITQKSEHYL